LRRGDGPRVKLYSRPGNDLTDRFPLIVEALARLRSRSCILDGEAVACDENGLASFDRIRHHRVDERCFWTFSTSKRKDSPFKSGRSLHSLKMKNPAYAAVKREAEEDWGK
jgi:bifunctional non-homologous end joining protein LigD